MTLSNGVHTSGHSRHAKGGGRGGIRTHGRLAPTPVFKTGALNHSATLPSARCYIGIFEIFSKSGKDWGIAVNAVWQRFAAASVPKMGDTVT